MTTIDDEESRKKIDIGIPRNLSLGILGIPSMFTRKELFRNCNRRRERGVADVAIN